MIWKDFVQNVASRWIFTYQREDGIDVYYCPTGDEAYYFREDNGFEYAVRLSDGEMFCLGLAK